ncbi:MAG: hypothetical protein CFE36_09655 [Sphingomonadaceae bacterium PASS1]|nr:MAG: hypothetical protein CFE36_09655 [Sphingomonadaceae bacterium PASS1]
MSTRPRKDLAGSRILLVGIAYKKNVDDLRESPSLRLIEKIEARGGAVDYFDPLIPIIPGTRDHGTLAGRESIGWDTDLIFGYDAVLIATDHDVVDYQELAKVAGLVVDTRNACARAGAPLERVVPA